MQITTREKEVLMQLKSGQTTLAIAEQLGISERRVRFHTENIVQKLCVNNRLEAVVQAVAKGWIV
jgi:DNA-binding NarL/FixJ family response regulator